MKLMKRKYICTNKNGNFSYLSNLFFYWSKILYLVSNVKEKRKRILATELSQNDRKPESFVSIDTCIYNLQRRIFF